MVRIKRGHRGCPSKCLLCQRRAGASPLVHGGHGSSLSAFCLLTWVGALHHCWPPQRQSVGYCAKCSGLPLAWGTKMERREGFQIRGRVCCVWATCYHCSRFLGTMTALTCGKLTKWQACRFMLIISKPSSEVVTLFPISCHTDMK